MIRNVTLGLLLLGLLAPSARAEEEIALSLRDCLERALSGSLEIQVGRFGPGIAETLVTEADAEFDHLFSFRTSGGYALSPVANALSGAQELTEQTFDASVALQQKVRFGGVYSLGFQTGDLLTNNSFFTLRPAWTNSLTFRFEQPVLRTAGTEYNEARTRIAEADLRAAQAEYRSVLEVTLAGVERAYWQLVFVRKDLEVKRLSETLADELLRITRKRLDAGAGTRIDVIQAEAGVTEREKEVILAENRVLNAEDLLRSFVFPFVREPDREIRIIPTEAIVPKDLQTGEAAADRIRLAMASRPDIQAAKDNLEAIGIRVVQTKDELLPRLDFFGSFSVNTLEDDFFDGASKLYRGDFNTWEVGLSLEIPIGNRAAKARHRRAVLIRSRAVASFESLRNQAVLQVRSAVRAVETAKREIAATRRATAASEAQFEAEKDRMRAEKSTSFRLLEIEQDLSQAKSQEILALTAYHAARARLEEATGTYLVSRGLVAPSAFGGDLEED